MLRLKTASPKLSGSCLCSGNVRYYEFARRVDVIMERFDKIMVQHLLRHSFRKLAEVPYNGFRVFKAVLENPLARPMSWSSRTRPTTLKGAC